MAVTEIQSFDSSVGAQPNFVSNAFTANAGDLILILEAHNITGSAPTTVADSNATAYTKQQNNARSTLGVESIWSCYYAAQAAGITVTITYPTNVTSRQVKIIRITGAPSSFLDTVTAGGTGGNAVIGGNGLSTSPVCGSMTPTTAVVVVACVAYHSSTAPSAVPAGYTHLGADILNATRVQGFSIYYKIQAVTGAENPAWTIPGVEWATGQIGIKQAPATPQKSRSMRVVSNSGGFTREDGTTNNLEAGTNEAVANDATYVQSPVDLSVPRIMREKIDPYNPPSGGGQIMKTRYAEDAVGSLTLNLKSRMYQGGGNTEGAGTLIKERTFLNVVPGFVEDDYSLSGGEVAVITDPGELYHEIEVWHT